MAWSGTPPNPPTDSRGLALETEARVRVGLPEDRVLAATRGTLAFWAVVAAGAIICVVALASLALGLLDILPSVAVFIVGVVVVLVGLRFLRARSRESR